jgi:hypothetical protein
MNELKSCPFCGGVAQVNTWTMHGITESRCFCPNSDCPNSVRTVALATWNTRPIEDALQARVAELEAAQRWIPVSERLPEFNKVVAVIDMSDKDSHLCNVYETAMLVEVRGDTRFGFIGHSGWDSSDVTHWMPLPKLPEVQE